MHVTSGTLKGLKIQTTKRQSEILDLRPTTGYSKQVLFNLLKNNRIVQIEIENSLVLDGFSGTGSVGIEFFSRGAAHITFVDSNLENTKQIKLQTAKLGVSSTVISGFFPKLPSLKSKFDIIFLDPPYNEGKGKVAQTIKNLLEGHLLDNGILILETLNNKEEIEKLKLHLGKKSILLNIALERESGSKTCFIFFKINDVNTQEHLSFQDDV